MEAGLEVLGGVVTAGVAAAGVVLRFVRGGKGAVVLAVGVALLFVDGEIGAGREAAIPPVAGAAPVYHGAKPKVCKYSIFGQTMVSQSGELTRPPVSPEFAFHANQKKLVMGLWRSSTGVPSGCWLRRYEARSANSVTSAAWIKVLPNSPIAMAKTCPP